MEFRPFSNSSRYFPTLYFLCGVNQRAQRTQIFVPSRLLKDTFQPSYWGSLPMDCSSWLVQYCHGNKQDWEVGAVLTQSFVYVDTGHRYAGSGTGPYSTNHIIKVHCYRFACFPNTGPPLTRTRQLPLRGWLQLWWSLLAVQIQTVPGNKSIQQIHAERGNPMAAILN